MSEKADEEVVAPVQARNYGAVRVGRVVKCADPVNEGSFTYGIVLTPDVYASPQDAERAVRAGETGEWAVIRLVSAHTVGRETITKAVVGKGPEL